MSEHRFQVGQRVYVVSKSILAAAANGAYEVTRRLPPEAGENQYRIKSEHETHERVARESQLSLTR